MTRIVELASAPIDADGMPTWSAELDSKAIPGLTEQEVVVVSFQLDGERRLGFAGRRILRARTRSWNVRILAIPGPTDQVTLSVWCSSGVRQTEDGAFFDWRWPQKAQLCATFDNRADALHAVRTWAAQIDEEAEDAMEPSLAGSALAPDQPIGLLREEDIESFLVEMALSERRAKD